MTLKARARAGSFAYSSSFRHHNPQGRGYEPHNCLQLWEAPWHSKSLLFPKLMFLLAWRCCHSISSPAPLSFAIVSSVPTIDSVMHNISTSYQILHMCPALCWMPSMQGIRCLFLPIMEFTADQRKLGIINHHQTALVKNLKSALTLILASVLYFGVLTSILQVKKQAQIHLAVGYISGGCEVSDLGFQPRPAGCSVVSSWRHPASLLCPLILQWISHQEPTSWCYHLLHFFCRYFVFTFPLSLFSCQHLPQIGSFLHKVMCSK